MPDIPSVLLQQTHHSAGVSELPSNCVVVAATGPYEFGDPVDEERQHR